MLSAVVPMKGTSLRVEVGVRVLGQKRWPVQDSVKVLALEV